MGSQLLDDIDQNEFNLEYMQGNGDVCLSRCKTFYPHKDKMKNGLLLSTMQQHMKSGK